MDKKGNRSLPSPKGPAADSKKGLYALSKVIGHQHGGQKPLEMHNILPRGTITYGVAIIYTIFI